MLQDSCFEVRAVVACSGFRVAGLDVAGGYLGLWCAGFALAIYSFQVTGSLKRFIL